MASGFGVNGGPGRCYSLWLDFTKCLGGADIPSECAPFREDYVECLHHAKEAARRRAIAAELKKQKAARKEQEKADRAAAKGSRKNAAS